MTDISKIAESLTTDMWQMLLEVEDDGHPVRSEHDRLVVFALHGAGLADFNSLNGLPSSWWPNSRGLAVRAHLLEGGE
jgi:predicted esterase